MSRAQAPIRQSECKNEKNCSYIECQGCGARFCDSCQGHIHFEHVPVAKSKYKRHTAKSTPKPRGHYNLESEPISKRLLEGSLDNYKRQLSSEIEDILECSFGTLENERWFKELETRLDEQRREMIRTIEDIYQELLNDAKKTYKKNRTLLVKRDKEISVIKILSRKKEKLNEEKIQNSLEMISEIKAQLKIINFEKYGFDTIQLKALFGELMAECYSDSASGMVVDVVPVDDHSAWIYRCGSSEIQLISGKTVTDVIEIDIEDCDGFLITRDGDVVYSDYEGKGIKYLHRSQHGHKIKTLLRFKKLHPYGLCNSKEDEGFFVCLNEYDICEDISKHALKTKRSVRHYNILGELLKSYGEGGPQRNYAFVFPTRVKQTMNSDLCVIDKLSADRGRLFVINNGGELKCMYQGQNDPFDPGDVCCDSHNNILVSDGANHTIHILHSDGSFMQMIWLDHIIHNPHTIALYNDVLWVGNTNGKLTTLTFSRLMENRKTEATA